MPVPSDNWKKRQVGKLYPLCLKGTTIKIINARQNIIYNNRLNKDIIANRDFVRIFKLCNGEYTVKDIVDNIFGREALSNSVIYQKVKKVLLGLEKEEMILFFHSPQKGNIRIIKNKYKYPLNYIYLEVTKKCNFSCIHCYANCPSLNQKGVDISTEMSKEDYFKLIDTLDEMGVVFIFITGGEPFMREDIFEILSYIYSKNIGFSILTNGSLLNTNKIQKLSKLRPQSIQVSFDCYDKISFDRIRGVGRYKQVLNTMEKIITHNLPLKINTVLFNEINSSYLDIKKLLSFLNSHLSVSDITFDAFIPQGEGLNKDYLQVNEKKTMAALKKAWREIHPDKMNIMDANSIKSATSDTFCGIGVEMIYIATNGDIFLCPGLSSVKYKIDNINNKNLEDIWTNSEMFAYFRKKNYLKDSECKGCVHLSDCDGGCKARAVYLHGHFNDKDPWMCAYYGKQ